MRKLDIIRQKRRFEMFNERSRDKVLELNTFFGKYKMQFEDRIKKLFVYYDTPDKDLEKSNIVLFKTQIGNFCELNMATEKINATYRYQIKTNYKHFTKPIKMHDNILKHKDFLIESFASMFMSGINFDAEFLMRKLKVAYTIETVSTEFRSLDVMGLKITYSFDKDKYTNKFNNQIAFNDVLTIYQHSRPETDADFADLMSKLMRYCKELTETTETKIMIARRKTETSLFPIKEKVDPKKKDKKDKKKK